MDGERSAGGQVYSRGPGLQRRAATANFTHIFLVWFVVYARVVRILRQKIANSVHVTCKFCALFSRIFPFEIISGIAVWPCLPH